MKRAFLIALVLFAAGLTTAHAADCGASGTDCYNQGASLSGGPFRILDSQHGGFGLFGSHISSSSRFTLLGTIGDLAIGQSSNSSTLQLKSGFLYYPLIVAPVPSATPGPSTGQVTVSWTPTRFGLTGTQGGLQNANYKVCWDTSSTHNSTPIGCSAFTSGLSIPVTPTTAGTYYFWVQAYDAYSSLISESETVQATTKASTPGGGGGGGGGYVPPTTNLTGLAFPFGTIHVMLNGVEIATTPTDANAVFNVNTTIVHPGTSNYGFWGTDRNGMRSVTWAFSVPIGGSGRVTGLIVPPTICLNDYDGDDPQSSHPPCETLFDPDDSFFVHGQSVPGATVEAVLSPGGRTAMGVVAPDGSYKISFSLVGLPKGIYEAKTRTLLLPAHDQSTWSQTLQFGIGQELPPACNHPPDVNHDTHINLVDFSIMAFWWKRAVLPDNPNDLNCDGVVNLADFSILAFHWTGR